MTTTATGPGRQEVDLYSSALRLALAVRGWTRPQEIAIDGDRRLIGAALDAVAQDVVIDIRAHPGQWWLGTESRRRIFATFDADRIAAALQDAPDDDVSSVLRLLFGEGPTEADIASLSDDALRTLVQAVGWLSEPVGGVRLAHRSATELERLALLASGMERARIRERDVIRMKGDAVVFKDLAETVYRTLLERPASEEPQVAYVWGPGGSGKSTLIAEVEWRARKLVPPPLIVHLDFDRPTLDPAKPQTLTLELLRQAGADPDRGGRKAREALVRYTSSIAAQSRDAHGAGRAEKGRKHPNARVARVLEKAEGVELEALRAERSIDFYDALSDFADHYRQLLLVLDTVEGLETARAGASASIGALEDWIKRIGRSSGISDIRVLAAGRRARHAAGESAWFEHFATVSEFELLPMDVEEKRRLLRSSGMPEDLVHVAARSLPGVPLIVRMAADTAATPGADLAQMNRSMEDGNVDPGTARRYLEERILRHVPEAWARPFAVGAFALPEVTPRLLSQIVIPAVLDELKHPPRFPRAMGSGKRKYDAIAFELYAILARLPWLTQAMVSRRKLTIISKIRELVEPLIEADPENGKLLTAVHLWAIKYHEDGPAYGAGEARARYHRARITDRSAASDARATSAPPSTRSIKGEAGTLESEARPIGRAEWLQSFELTALKHLETGTVRGILDMWAQRPPALKLTLPDIVIRALADTGALGSSLIDLDALSSRMRGPAHPSRSAAVVFRATAADLLPMGHSKAKSLSDRRRLAHTVDGLVEERSGRSGRDFDAIVAMALILRRHVASATLRRLRDEAVEHGANSIRGAALRCVGTGEHVVDVDASQLFVAQRDFEDRGVRAIMGSEHPMLVAKASELKDIDRHFARLKGVVCRLRLYGPPSQDVKWLRGMTPEWHSPLRYALEDCWLGRGRATPSEQKDVLRHVVMRVTSRMTLLPREFEQERFWRNVEYDSGAWFGAFVRFVDMARLLRSLADEILDAVPERRGRQFGNLHAIAGQVVIWDRALSSGGNSDWSTMFP